MGEHDEQFIFKMGYNKGFKDGIKSSIPKADYKARLKADMVAMLVELQLEIEDFITDNHSSSDLRRNEAIICCTQVIQQKINELKGNTDGNR